MEQPAGRADSLGAPSHHRANRQGVPRLRQLVPRLGVESNQLRLLLWVEPTSGVTAYYGWGFGGQLVEVVPDLHLVIVVSSNADDTHGATVDPDQLQHLVDAIVPIIKTHPTR